LRHIWEFDEAISQFRNIVNITSDGEQRRRVQAKLAEALLITAIYYDDIDFTYEIKSTPEQLISEADENVSEISGFRKVSEESSYLYDRVQLELTEGEVDWKEIERTYNLIVGGTGLYYETLSSNIQTLDNLQEELDDYPTSMAGFLKLEPTQISVLRQLGALFRRRAELENSPDPLSDFERSMAVYEVCVGWEEQYEGKPRVTSCFGSARAIIGAILYEEQRQPFDTALLQNVRTNSPLKGWIDLADRRLQSAKSRSIGAFHKTVCREFDDFLELRNALMQ